MKMLINAPNVLILDVNYSTLLRCAWSVLSNNIGDKGIGCTYLLLYCVWCNTEGSRKRGLPFYLLYNEKWNKRVREKYEFDKYRETDKVLYR